MKTIKEDAMGLKKKITLELGNIEFWLPLLIEGIIVVIVFFSMRETIRFLYADDDLVTSLYRGAYFLGGITLKGMLKFLLKEMLFQLSRGRFMIGGFLTYIPVLLFNITQYRVYILVLICVNVWLFGQCVYQWTGSYKTKWLSMLLTPLFFQIHYNFHHPILSYYGGIQLLFVILFLSMYCFWNYCVNRKNKWLIISGVLYLWGLISYEVAFVLLPVFPLLAFLATKSIKKAILYSLSHISLFGLFLIANIVNRFIGTQNDTAYPGASFNFNVVNILATTIKQFTASFPLSNFFITNWERYNTFFPKMFSLMRVTPGDLLTIILFLLVLFLIYRTVETGVIINKKDNLTFGFLGFLIIFLPSFLMGLSARYQQEIGWGRGHVPVYFEYFGLAILLVAIYNYFLHFLHRTGFHKIFTCLLNIVLIILSIFTLLANQQYGRSELYRYDSSIYNKMLALQYALEDKIIADVPRDALIINSQVVPTFLSNSDYSSEFFVNYSKKRLKNVVYIDDFNKKIVDDLTVKNKFSENEINYSPNQATYIVRTNRDDNEGTVYVGKVVNMVVNLKQQKIVRYEVDEIRIYTMNKVTAKYVSLYEKELNKAYEHKYYELEPNLLESLERGRLYKYEFVNTWVDFNSAFIAYDLDSVDTSLYDVQRQLKSIELSKEILVGNNPSLNGSFESGWSNLEGWGRWSDGNQSILDMLIKEPILSDLLITFNVNIFAPKENLRFSVYINGSLTGTYSIPAGEQSFSVPISKAALLKNNGAVKMEFEITNPISPMQAGLSSDPRLIGIGVKSFVISANE